MGNLAITYDKFFIYQAMAGLSKVHILHGQIWRY